MKFPFLEPDEPNTAAIICSHVLEQGAPILYASHDDEDGMWQFLCDAITRGDGVSLPGVTLKIAY